MHPMLVSTDSSTLKLVQQLCQALDTQGVSYCHWKSNAALDRSARGENDLDLLVSRPDVEQFTAILSRLQFKEARGSATKQVPGILSYHAYDREADKFVHVHIHYQLVLGHDMTKNYHLPIERAFFESAFQDSFFKIPVPELEFIVLVIRLVLKHSTWDAVLGRQAALSRSEQQELEYLQGLIEQARVPRILEQHLPFIGATFFDQCLQTLRPGCSLWTRLKAGQRLQRKLRAHSRRSLTSDVCLKYWRRTLGVYRRYILLCSPRKRLAKGGAIVALVGGDGAGKSTAVDGLYAWLSKFATIKVHLGKPTMSLSTLAIKATSKMCRLAGTFLKGKYSVQAAENKPYGFPGYLQSLRRVCIARDRYRTYARARRFASNGGLVICDRYPVPQITLMDGPQSDSRPNGGRAKWFARFLVQTERTYYQHILLPELLIVLRVDPEIAVDRRTDGEEATVRARCQEIYEMDWRQTPAHVINAGRSKAEVLSDLKSIIWAEL